MLERVLAQAEYILDPKWFVETGRIDGGRHYYYRYPNDRSIPTLQSERVGGEKRRRVCRGSAFGPLHRAAIHLGEHPHR